MGVQSGAYEYQDGCGQGDDSIVGAQTDGARAAGKQESAHCIDDMCQRI
jgi:hypothetical protein